MRYRLEAADGTALGVSRGRIVEATGTFDLVVALGPGELRAGLINAHDHLHRNHFPRLGAPPYTDSYAWGRDLHERFANDVARHRAVDRTDALLFGALKNLLAGATTVVHHDPWEPTFDGGFPVRVPRLPTAHSLRLEPELAAAAAGDARRRDRPFCIHLAEGTAPEAADEVRELDRLGLLNDRLVAVHVVGADDDGVRRLRDADAAIVWCPTSNRFLFGRTAPAALMAPGIDMLIGSDSLLTGDGTLLDELRAARALALVDDARLLAGVGAIAARRLGLATPSLEPGANADLALFRRPVLDARAEDVELVIVGGVPRLGDARFRELFERSGVAVEDLEVGRSRKVVASPLATVAEMMVARAPECGRIFG